MSRDVRVRPAAWGARIAFDGRETVTLANPTAEGIVAATARIPKSMRWVRVEIDHRRWVCEIHGPMRGPNCVHARHVAEAQAAYAEQAVRNG